MVVLSTSKEENTTQQTRGEQKKDAFFIAGITMTGKDV
jgi:hypothetical protein